MTQKASSAVGYVGLLMVVAATILSPTGFAGVTLCLLVPMGFGGLLVCLVSLAWKPRLPGIVGLVIGITCVGLWLRLFYEVDQHARARAGKFGLTVQQHSEVSMAAMDLAMAGERQRQADGSPASTVVLVNSPVDPWRRPYRYVLNGTPRGFSFISDGPDGVAGTGDDIDLFTIQDGDMFSLPPIGTR